MKDEEFMRSGGESSCTGIETRAEVTSRDRERGGKEQREVIKPEQKMCAAKVVSERWGHGKMGL